MILERRYSPSTFDFLRRDIHRRIEDRINSLGIYSRIFSRIKDAESTEKKLTQKKDDYIKENKKMQDFLGVRVTVYFEDDVEIVSKILKGIFAFDSESVDRPDHEKFSPKRHNIIFKIPEGTFQGNPSNLIDETFEVQIRTIFSEGWHEIEHDLRYKNKSHWEKQPGQSRGLNAILASLELCDWGISKLTDDMAHNAYHSLDLTSLTIHKFRLRLASTSIEKFFLDQQFSKEFLKKILRSRRDSLIEILAKTKGEIPVNANNILWLLAKTQGITNYTEDIFPSPIKDVLLDYDLWNLST